MSRRNSHGTARQYPRTARLNELLREILAEELERLDDDRLELLTITSVDIEGDLRHASVYYDSLDGEDGDEQVLEALGELRWRLQAAIGREARMKRTPELSFAPDPGVRAGARIEELLAEMPPVEADEAQGPGDASTDSR
jgi:ribosome-binding factor A